MAAASRPGRGMTGRRLPVGPRALFASVIEYRAILLQFARREVTGRYRGSMIGFGWAVLNPLLLLCVYTFVFSVIFSARWNGPSPDRFGFALAVYTGMIVHGFFAECMTGAPNLIVNNRNLVKRVVFPLQLLPWSVLLVAGFHFVIGLLLLVFALLISAAGVPASVLALPVVIAPLGLLALGVTYAFSSLGVYLRDLSQVVGFIALVLLFLSPVFYPISAVPESWRWAIAWNPIATFIEMTRDALLFAKWPRMLPLLGMWILGVTVAFAGFYWFQRTRRGFADVL